MIDFSQHVVVIGKKADNGIVKMLGSGFFVSNDYRIATARHVIGNEYENLVMLLPHISNINQYQDVSDNTCKYANAKVLEINPITDLAILKIEQSGLIMTPPISSLDNIKVGERIGIFGFPHCVMGRRVLTYHEAEIGAKMLLESSGIKAKYATLNLQTRPGQSGSLVFNPMNGDILGLLIGTYAPDSGVNIAGINPYELNQTSYCISANHIREML